MKKLALVGLVVLVFGALASAQSFGFYNSGGSLLYCNYEVFVSNSGGVVGGYDNTTAACGYSLNSPAVGFDTTLPNDGPPAHGKGVIYGDAIYDDGCLCYSGDQWTVFSALKASKQNKFGHFIGPYGWVGVAGTYTGFYFGDNYGFLTTTLPGHNEANHGTSAGKMNR